MLKKILLATLSVVFLEGCQSFPDRGRRLVVEQCSPFFHYETVEVVRAEGLRAELTIDMRKSECNCRRYKYALDFIGPIANTIQTKPIEYCHKVIGNTPDEYMKVVNFLGDLRRDLQEAK